MPPLSLVFQGPVAVPGGEADMRAVANILQARRCYPQAEIVVSTWMLPAKRQDYLQSLLATANIRWVWNEDPGPIAAQLGEHTVISNVNRLRVSAAEGIRASTGEFVAKLRTDCRLVNDTFLSLVDTYFSGAPLLKQDPAFRVFSQHVINANIYARSPHGTRPFLFHPGDIFLLGRRADVLAFFDVPAANNDLMDPYGRRQPFSLMRRVPEQYFWMHCIRRLHSQHLTDADLTLTAQNRRRSDQFYVSNFYPLAPADLGLRWQKLGEDYRWKDRWLSIYIPAEWQQIYQREVLGLTPGINVMLLARHIAVTGIRVAYKLRDRLLHRRCVLQMIFRLLGRHRRQTKGIKP